MTQTQSICPCGILTLKCFFWTAGSSEAIISGEANSNPVDGSSLSVLVDLWFPECLHAFVLLARILAFRPSFLWNQFSPPFVRSFGSLSLFLSASCTLTSDHRLQIYITGKTLHNNAWFTCLVLFSFSFPFIWSAIKKEGCNRGSINFAKMRRVGFHAKRLFQSFFF